MDHEKSIEKAQLLLSTGRYQMMTDLLLPVCASSDPDLQEAAYRLLIGKALMEDHCREAIHFSNKALANGLDTVQVRLLAGYSFHDAGLYRKALKHLQAAHKKEPKNVDINRTLAQTFFNLEDYRTAEKFAREAVSAAPEDAASLTVLSVICINRKKNKEGQALLDKALSIDPLSESALGIRAELTNNDTKKIGLYKHLLTINPLNKQAAKEYRSLNGPFKNLDWLLFVIVTLLSAFLFAFPQLISDSHLEYVSYLCLPAFIIIGRDWRKAFPFFLINFTLLSFDTSLPMGRQIVWLLFIAVGYSLIFYTLSAFIFSLKNYLVHGWERLKRRLSQGTFRARIVEPFNEALENNDTKKIRLYKHLLKITRAVKESRYFNGSFKTLDWVLIVIFTLLSIALFTFPQLTSGSNSKNCLWLYLPAAIVIGNDWRKALPFFLINCVLLSQVANLWLDWSLKWMPFLAMSFTLKFFILSKLLSLWKDDVAGKWQSLRQHASQRTIGVKAFEQFNEFVNADSALILLGNTCLYLACLPFISNWLALPAFLPLLLPIKHRFFNLRGLGSAFLLLIYGNSAIIIVALFIAFPLSLLPVFLIVLLQLKMIHRKYLREVHYGFTR